MLRFRKSEVSSSTSQSNQYRNIDGSEMKKQYEDIINLPSNKNPQKSKPITKTRLRIATRKKVFDKTKFFFAVANNDLKSLHSMKITSENINAIDEFNWTALMMASCANHIDIVKFLCENGANREMRNKKGLNAHDLATNKNNRNVANYLDKFNPNPVVIISDSSSDEELIVQHKIHNTYCETCKCRISEENAKKHITSTLHRFNEKNAYKFARHFGIPDSNVGFQLMLKQGWNRENGLGPEQEGQLYPVKTVIRKFRSGLGVKQQKKPRVTHYQSFDRNAIKDHRPQQPKPSSIRKQMKRQKARDKRRELHFRNLLTSD